MADGSDRAHCSAHRLLLSLIRACHRTNEGPPARHRAQLLLRADLHMRALRHPLGVRGDVAIAIVAVDPVDQKELHAVRSVDAGVDVLRRSGDQHAPSGVDLRRAPQLVPLAARARTVCAPAAIASPSTINVHFMIRSFVVSIFISGSHPLRRRRRKISRAGKKVAANVAVQRGCDASPAFVQRAIEHLLGRLRNCRPPRP